MRQRIGIAAAKYLAMPLGAALALTAGAGYDQAQGLEFQTIPLIAAALIALCLGGSVVQRITKQGTEKEASR